MGSQLSEWRLAIADWRLTIKRWAQVLTLKRRLGAASRRHALKGKEAPSFRTRRAAPSDGLSRRTIGEDRRELGGDGHGLSAVRVAIGDCRLAIDDQAMSAGPDAEASARHRIAATCPEGQGGGVLQDASRSAERRLEPSNDR